jgi:hypothetical protein
MTPAEKARAKAKAAKAATLRTILADAVITAELDELEQTECLALVARISGNPCPRTELELAVDRWLIGEGWKRLDGIAPEFETPNGLAIARSRWHAMAGLELMEKYRPTREPVPFSPGMTGMAMREASEANEPPIYGRIEDDDRW